MSDIEDITEELPLEPQLRNLSLRNFRGGSQLPTWKLAERDVEMPKKHSLGKLLQHNWELRDPKDLVLKVGTEQTCVNRMRFICYSRYAMAQVEGGQRELVLPESRVPLVGLVRICEWMTQPVAKLDHQDIVHILATALFLEIEPLINQIWFCLDMLDEFTEERAFAVAYDAHRLGDMLPMVGLDINRLHHINRFFLTLVASAEFVEMPFNHVRCLLDSDFLAVNTEMEVFYAAVRWLNHDWEERNKHLMGVMECVRLVLLPLEFLKSLQPPSKEPALKCIIAHHEFRELAYEAYTVRTLTILNDGTMLFDQLYDIFDIRKPGRRPFICHDLCPYHRAHPNDEEAEVSYREYLHYLALLQQNGPYTWKSLQVEGSPIDYFGTENARNEPFFVDEEDEDEEEEEKEQLETDFLTCPFVFNR